MISQRDSDIKAKYTRMTKKHFLSDKEIKNNLKIHYGIRLATLINLPLGADMNAQVYKGKTLDQISYFIKLKKGHFQDIGITITSFLQAAGVKEIILPIKNIYGQDTYLIKDCTFIVYPFVQGEDGFSRHLTKNQWLILGKVMKQIHDIHIPPFLQDKIRHEDFTSKWRESVRSFYMQNNKPANDLIGQKFRDFMQKNANIIYKIIERSEELAQKLKDQSHKFVLCHSDLHAGNVLIDENGSIYIVDWDDPVMAPKERDLMFIGGGVGNVWNIPYEINTFYQGYGEVKINTELLAYYRYERIVQDISEYSEQLLDHQENDKGRLTAYEHFVGQFDPNGVVEIAFKTDEID